MSSKDSGTKNNKSNFLEKFVLRFYESQPSWVRTTVYLMFAIILGATAYKTIGGQVILQGQIIEQTADGGERGALGYDVVIGDKYYGTNSKGIFYALLDSLQFAMVFSSKQLEVDIFQGNVLVERGAVLGYRYFASPDLETVTLTSSPEGAEDDVLGYSGKRKTFAQLLSNPFGTAIASTLANDRLMIKGIRIPSSSKEQIPVKLSLEVDGQEVHLRSAKLGNRQLERIEIPSGKKWELDPVYFFELPGQATQGILHVEAFYGLLSTTTKNITFVIPERYGVQTEIRSDSETEIILQRLSPYDVLIFDKKDLYPVKAELMSALTARGFRVLEYSSPLGYSGQTNAIFGGQEVPINELQKVLDILHSNGMQIKTIRRGIKLRSGNKYEIQIGGAKRLNDKEPISASAIEEIITTKSTEIFDRLGSGN
jgi:hypothetical protein